MISKGFLLVFHALLTLSNNPVRVLSPSCNSWRFSVSLAALLKENSDKLDLASLPVVDPPRSDYVSMLPNPIVPNSGLNSLDINLGSEPNPLNGNLGVTSFRTPDISMPSPYSTEIAQEPSAGVSSIIGPSSADPNNICSPSSIGRKQCKRQQCINLESALSEPDLPVSHHPQADGTLEEENGKLRREEREWLAKYIPSSLTGVQRRATVQALANPGFDACSAGDDSVHTTTLCCLGPPQSGPLARRQTAILPNIRNCVLFMTTLFSASPFCAVAGRRYCCRTFNPNIMDEWGFLGIECLSMDWEGPEWGEQFELGVRSEVQPSGVAENSADTIFLELDGFQAGVDLTQQIVPVEKFLRNQSL